MKMFKKYFDTDNADPGKKNDAELYRAAVLAQLTAAYNEANDRYVLHIKSEALEALQSYDWPGNVRELQNYIERAVVMAESDELTVDLLPEDVQNGQSQPRTNGGGIQPTDPNEMIHEIVKQSLSDPDSQSLYSDVVNQVERELIAQVMASCNQVRTKAATRLGINRNTLHKKLKEYNLSQE